MISAGGYPKYRAPQGDGEILCIPSRTELPELVERNRQRSARLTMGGRKVALSELARSARREFLSAAESYTSEYVDPQRSSDWGRPLIVTGHQPELFHPGVWLKNFEAARLAEATGGVAVDLIIDSDLCRWPAIRVPAGDAVSLRNEMVPLDGVCEELPFEERGIVDRNLWISFGVRVVDIIKPLVGRPLVESWWPSVIAASERTENLGAAISQARHQCELQWSSRGLELPQSRVCQTTAFRHFAFELISRAAEFRVAHNTALANYRAAHGIKNHAQPVPDLADADGWTELPLWTWSTTCPQRRAVFARTRADRIELSDLGGMATSLPLEGEAAVEKLAQLEHQGVKLRTRALTTTLFARLLLADVFIHGLGGAKYDQVTEEISQSFFKAALPAHAVISGTLRLPIPPPSKRPRSISELRRELREYEFHPERHRDKMAASQQTSEIDHWVGVKKKWIDAIKTPENAGLRHQAIGEANRKLLKFLRPQQDAMEMEIEAAREFAAREQLRTAREYAYCLFPEALLRDFLGA